MARVMFAWPPLNSKKGYATLTQNRQFQWFHNPTYIYPIIPAWCASMLASKGHEVHWLDGIANEFNDIDFGRIMLQSMPEYIIFEASTPVIKRYWEVINDIKVGMPEVKIILAGDHVTALPEESKANCKADYILTGGDWFLQAFALINGGFDQKEVIPHINRNLTHWWLYAYKNGNFKYLPGTYIMSSIDCWYKKCSFCSWANYYKNYIVRPVSDVLMEIENLIVFGFKEIFDDAGTLSTGEWLQQLCKGIYDNGYDTYASFGCNMRFGALNKEDFIALGRAGFRTILWGLESANQSTLDRLNKGYDIKAVMQDLILAKAAGLESHITVMFGYYWESYEEAKRTYDMARWLLKKGWVESAQATICIPYPITPLWKECKEAGMLLTEDWNEYDMTAPVMKVPYPVEELFKFQKDIYNTAFNLEFLMRKISKIRNIDDLKYYFRIGRKVYDRFGNFYSIGKPQKI